MISEESVEVVGFKQLAQAGKSRRKRGQSFVFGEPHRIQIRSAPTSRTQLLGTLLFTATQRTSYSCPHLSYIP